MAKKFIWLFIPYLRIYSNELIGQLNISKGHQSPSSCLSLWFLGHFLSYETSYWSNSVLFPWCLNYITVILVVCPYTFRKASHFHLLHTYLNQPPLSWFFLSLYLRDCKKRLLLKGFPHCIPRTVCVNTAVCECQGMTLRAWESCALIKLYFWLKLLPRPELFPRL